MVIIMTQWKEEIRKVPGYEIEWYAVFEIAEGELELLDKESISIELLRKIEPRIANVIHDLRAVSEMELRDEPIEKRKLDVLVNTENGYLSMSLVSDSILVIASLRKK